MAFKAIETQEELNEIIESRLKREREAAEKKYAEYISPADFEDKTKALKEQIASLTNSTKVSEDKAKDFQAQIDALNKEVATHKLSAVKTQVALSMGLPYELAGRLTGEDEEAIKKDAEFYKELITSQSVTPLASTEPATQGDSKDEAFKQMLTGLNI